MPTLEQAADGHPADVRAFERAYARHVRSVVRTAEAVLRDPHTAEDVAQDVFLKLWLRPRAFDADRASLGAYLGVMARSRALDVWRSEAAGARAARRLGHDADAASAVRLQDGAAAGDRRLAAASTRAAVRRLPCEQREAVALAYWGDLTAAD